MENRGNYLSRVHADAESSWYNPRLRCRPDFLHLVTRQELEELQRALARGQVPTDFEAKLNGLAEGGLADGQIEQNCRSFIALLQAVYDGSFRDVRKIDCDRILRVLAYVRKDDDEIADYKPKGFVDDYQEVQAIKMDLGNLLQNFKAWRLRHQVPVMWR